MKKKILLLAVTTILSVSLLFTATGLCSEKQENTDEGRLVTSENYEPYTFEEFKECLKKDLTKDQMAKVKSLFDKAIALEEKQEIEKASDIWNEIDSMDVFDCEDCDFEYTFEELKKELKSDVSPKDLKKAEQLFDKAIALDKEGKYDEANKVWNELYSLNIFTYEMDYEDFTFDSLEQEFKKDVSKEDINKAKALFDKAMELEKKDKFDDAEKVWEQLYALEIFDHDFGEFEEYTYDMFKQELKKDISKDDHAKAKQLFEKASELDKIGKFDDAKKVWDELYDMDIFQEVCVVNE